MLKELLILLKTFLFVLPIMVILYALIMVICFSRLRAGKIGKQKSWPLYICKLLVFSHKLQQKLLYDISLTT